MDFSTLYTVKNGNDGEIGRMPVPPEFEMDLQKGGISFELFYDNMQSRPQKEFLGDGMIPVRTFPFYCLLQLISGDGYFYDGENRKMHFLRPGDGLCIPPGFPHRYGGYVLNFVEDSVCFSGPLADVFLKHGLLRKGIFRFGRERRLAKIIQRLRQSSLPSLLEAQALLSSLILALYRENGGSVANRQEKSSISPLIRALQADDVEWSVTAMAEYARISENYLRRLFLQETGLSPKQFQDRLWLGRAAEAVCDRSRKLSRIAEQFGNGDAAYFYRRFKKLTGLTPTEYRNVYSHNSDVKTPEDFS